MADLSEARGRHSATLLANGTVLIAGGSGNGAQPVAEVQLFDPATGSFTRVG
jgi:Galactose oxidase, central domain